MKAVRYLGPGHVEIASITRPVPKDDEVLVETRAVSICNQTDIRVYNGVQTTYPLEWGVPGREGAGVVVEAGSKVKGLKVGTPVAMIGERLYAEYSVRNPQDVVALRPGTNLVEAAPLGLAGCVLAAARKIPSMRGRNVIVSGLGPAGLLMIQAARSVYARKITALDIRRDHLELARSLGATIAVLANDRDIIAGCRRSPADFGIDCSGSAQAVGLLSGMCSTILAFGAVHETIKIDLPSERPFSIVNGYLTEEERREGLALAVNRFLRKQLLTGPLISQVMHLDEYALGMQKVRRGEVLKLVLTCP
jgi:threonine dehydrogenase-like Zn-dependent dehydrogenase